ncbi:ribonuclease H [Trichonephila clavipes]|nr:ribonuclease H [Trichonephila clavipes]
MEAFPIRHLGTRPLGVTGSPRAEILPIVTSLLEPCTKREPTSIIKAKGLNTIGKYPQEDFVFAYTDGSSDETFLNGGSGVFMTTPSDANYQRIIGAGAIAFCFTCEREIIEALNLYETLPILEQTRCLVII